MHMLLDEKTLDQVSKLSALGFANPRFFSEDHWGAVAVMGSFVAVVDGDTAALSVGYRRRWCYRDFACAMGALTQWDGEGEPTGWIMKDPDNDTDTMKVWP